MPVTETFITSEGQSLKEQKQKQKSTRSGGNYQRRVRLYSHPLVIGTFITSEGEVRDVGEKDVVREVKGVE